MRINRLLMALLLILTTACGVQDTSFTISQQIGKGEAFGNPKLIWLDTDLETLCKYYRISESDYWFDEETAAMWIAENAVVFEDMQADRTNLEMIYLDKELQEYIESTYPEAKISLSGIPLAVPVEFNESLHRIAEDRSSITLCSYDYEGYRIFMRVGKNKTINERAGVAVGF